MKKGTAAGLIGLAAAGVGITGTLVAIGNALYSKTVGAMPTDRNKTDSHPLLQEGRQWARDAVDFRSLTIPAGDDLILWSAMVLSKADSHRWAICLHGYRDCHESMGAIGKHYAELGWNVLMPDQRGHGNSQGNYVGWGYDERLDVVAWINYIIRRDPEAEIVLHGVSMGAATVLLTTGGPLQAHVKAAVADCGYTSAEEVMKHALDRHSRKSLGIPPVLPFSVLFSALRKITLRPAGYDMANAAPIQAVGRSRIPTLFIHGVCDDIVPPAMMGRLYETARCPKRFLWVPDAGHADSVGANPELYWSTVHEFLSKYMD
jgi:fermentation-respiration switch protein FrsA (DUF1100 family)